MRGMGGSRDHGTGSLFPEVPSGGEPEARADAPRAEAPLADRVRPRTLDEILGQDEVLGPGRPLRRAIEQDQLRSLILGTGRIIAVDMEISIPARHRWGFRHDVDAAENIVLVKGANLITCFCFRAIDCQRSVDINPQG